jgi:hypothetical protein
MQNSKQYLDTLDARMKEMRLEIAVDLAIFGKSILPRSLQQYRSLFDNYMLVARSAGIPELKGTTDDLEKIAAYNVHLSKVG